MAVERFLADRVTLYSGDCREVLARLPECSIDSTVTDPPYHLTSIVKRFAATNESDDTITSKRVRERADGYARLVATGFMGKVWDGGDIAFDPETWCAVLRVLKPGAHLLAFGGTRTYHRMACAIEDAGFEIRDCIQWLYGSGFPKSHDVSKGIDRAAGAERERIGTKVELGIRHNPGRENETSPNYARPWRDDPDADGHWVTAPATDAARQWEGWGTALKPACELIVLARKPLSEGTVAANVLKWGTGALNIDGCRVGVRERPKVTDPKHNGHEHNCYGAPSGGGKLLPDARWPANVIHDGSEEVTAAFPETGISSGGRIGNAGGGDVQNLPIGRFEAGNPGFGDSGSAVRFFYEVKQDDPCHSIRHASDVGGPFALQSEHVVFALRNAVEQSTARLVLSHQSVRARDMNVSAMELKLACESVIEAIQNIERRYLLALPPESVSVRLGHVTCVAIPNRIGTTTITINLSKSDHSVEAVTFAITETFSEVGARDYAKRFHYTSKADSDDRLGSKHPTVKPLDLMQYLVRLITPPKGICLDPFAGTGTTGEAAWREGMSAVLIEREAEYCADIRRRMALALAGPDERARESIKAKNLPRDDGPLFATLQNEAWAEMWARPFDFSKLKDDPSE